MAKHAICLRFAYLFSFISFLLFLALGIQLLGRAAQGRAPAGTLTIEPSLVALGEMAPGSKNTLTFKATNFSPREVSLLGMERVCKRWGCLGRADFPVSLPPHSSRVFGLDIVTASEGFDGDFVGDITLYSDIPGSGRIVFTFTGRIIRSQQRAR